MANKRPPLEMDVLTENLKQSSGKGVGAFFSTPPSPTPKKENLMPQQITDQEQREKQKLSQATMQSKQLEANQAGNIDATTSSRHDVNHRVWRDIIENTETHNSALRLTNAERFEVEDLVSELRRKYKIKTSMNEIARLGLLYLIHDFKQNRTKSLIHDVKKS